MQVTAQDVRAAADAIKSHIVRTPTVPAPRLGEPLGVRLALKLESLQSRGRSKDPRFVPQIAAPRAATVPAGGGGRAASAGNHAQGVAYHARRLGLPATIVMPRTTPFSKVERTEALGATVVQHGANLSESYEHAQQLRVERGLEFVHPYDDPAIVAGQGTAAIELLEDHPDSTHSWCRSAAVDCWRACCCGFGTCSPRCA